MKRINLYQSVFYGALYDSPDVKADLDQLGLPERLASFAKKTYFERDIGKSREEADAVLAGDFYGRVSHGDVALFYGKHPERLWGNLRFSAENAFFVRPYYLGNFEKVEGKPPGALSYRFSGWSEFKRKVLPHQVGFILAVYAAYFGTATYQWLRSKRGMQRVMIELYMLPGVIGVFAFVTPVLGDGRADMGKHLFLFNVCFDMMLVTGMIWILLK